MKLKDRGLVGDLILILVLHFFIECLNLVLNKWVITSFMTIADQVVVRKIINGNLGKFNELFSCKIVENRVSSYYKAEFWAEGQVSLTI